MSNFLSRPHIPITLVPSHEAAVVTAPDEARTPQAPPEDTGPHSARITRQEIIQNVPRKNRYRNRCCPCGSGKKFKHCHW